MKLIYGTVFSFDAVYVHEFTSHNYVRIKQVQGKIENFKFDKDYRNEKVRTCNKQGRSPTYTCRYYSMY